MRVYEASLTYNLVQLGDDVAIDTAQKAAEYLKSAFEITPMQESFWVILLNRKTRAIGRVRITLGTATSALAHPREVFRPAILANACAIICAHNHPSGDPAPSAQDMQVTRVLREAAKVVDITLIDHVVVGYARFSFALRAAKANRLLTERAATLGEIITNQLAPEPTKAKRKIK